MKEVKICRRQKRQYRRETRKENAHIRINKQMGQKDKSIKIAKVQKKKYTNEQIKKAVVRNKGTHK